MSLFHFLVNRQCNRESLQHKGESEHSVGPFQICWWMRMREFFDAFVDRVRRTNTKDKNRCYERPEKPFFPVTERVLVGGWSFEKPQTKKQKVLFGLTRNGVDRLGHHAGGASDKRGDQL